MITIMMTGADIKLTSDLLPYALQMHHDFYKFKCESFLIVIFNHRHIERFFKRELHLRYSYLKNRNPGTARMVSSVCGIIIIFVY